MVIAVIVQTLFNRITQILLTVAVNRTTVTATAAAMVAAIIAGVVMAGPARAMMAGAAMTTMVAADMHAAVVSLALMADVTPHIAAGDGHRAVTQALSSLSGLSAIAAGHAIIPFPLQSLSYRHMVAGLLAPHIP
jgi:LytS/YehU family sensor histidine kinase